MNWLRGIFGGRDSTPPPLTLDLAERKEQLRRLETALDRLVAEMREHGELMANPGWKERVAEYQRVSGEAMLARSTGLTREALLDISFEVRPVFRGTIPAGLEAIGPRQDEAVAAALALQDVLPGERGDA